MIVFSSVFLAITVVAMALLIQLRNEFDIKARYVTLTVPVVEALREPATTRCTLLRFQFYPGARVPCGRSRANDDPPIQVITPLEADELGLLARSGVQSVRDGGLELAGFT